MADLSKFSDMMALEELLEELVKYIRIYMLPHCYRVAEKGVIMMKIFAIDELRMFDLPKHCKSTVSFITSLLSFVDELINKKKSVDPISVIQKSAIEKLTNNLCNDLPTCDVAGQDTIRPSQAKIVKPNFPSKSTETKSSASTLGGQQNKGKGTGCTAIGLTVSSSFFKSLLSLFLGGECTVLGTGNTHYQRRYLKPVIDNRY